MFTFKYETEETSFDSGMKIKMELDRAVSLDDIIEKFEYFLKGCGYTFDGMIDIVEAEEDTSVIDNINAGLEEAERVVENQVAAELGED